MILKSATITIIVALFVIAGCVEEGQLDKEKELAEVRRVIETSIGWAKTKDTTALYDCFMQDSTLFFFNPNNAGNMHGFDNFVKQTNEVFLNDAFKAIRYDIKDMKLGISQSGQSAWWSCYLDDINEWDGKPANWINVRWSGVLDKRDGKWKIMQMHFSHAVEDFKKSDEEKN